MVQSKHETQVNVVRIREHRVKVESRADPLRLHAQTRSISRGRKKPVVVFSHGFSVDGLESHRLFHKTSRVLNEAGYSCLMYDNFGIGYSDGDYRDFRLSLAARDLVDMAEFALKRTRNNGKVVVLGQSLGTAAAALAEVALRRVCAGIVLWNLSADIKGRYPALFGDGIATDPNHCLEVKGHVIGSDFFEDAIRLDVLGSFDDWCTPVLFLNAQADEVSTSEYAQVASERVDPSLQTTVRIVGANHSFKCQPDLESDAVGHTLAWVENVACT